MPISAIYFIFSLRVLLQRRNLSSGNLPFFDNSVLVIVHSERFHAFMGNRTNRVEHICSY